MHIRTMVHKARRQENGMFMRDVLNFVSVFFLFLSFSQYINTCQVRRWHMYCSSKARQFDRDDNSVGAPFLLCGKLLTNLKLLDQRVFWRMKIVAGSYHTRDISPRIQSTLPRCIRISRLETTRRPLFSTLHERTQFSCAMR
jgi:hypothetical protein